MNATKTSRPKNPYDESQAEAGCGEIQALFDEREWPPDGPDDGPPEGGQVGPLRRALYYSVLARS